MKILSTILFLVFAVTVSFGQTPSSVFSTEAGAATGCSRTSSTAAATILSSSSTSGTRTNRNADADACLYSRRRMDIRQQGNERSAIPAVSRTRLAGGECRIPDGGQFARPGGGRGYTLRASLGLSQRQTMEFRHLEDRAYRPLRRRTSFADHRNAAGRNSPR